MDEELTTAMHGMVMVDFSAYTVLLLGYGKLALSGGMLYAAWRRNDRLLRRFFVLLLLLVLLSWAFTCAYTVFFMWANGMPLASALSCDVVFALPLWGRTMAVIFMLLLAALYVQHRQHGGTRLLKAGLYVSGIMVLLVLLFFAILYAGGLDRAQMLTAYDRGMMHMVRRYCGYGL